MDILPPKKIKIIKIKNKNRGVVATEKIFKNEIIEYCPLVIMGAKDIQFIKNKRTSDVLYYYYLQQPDLKRNCIILGYGSLYNHSSDPNSEIDYEDDPQQTYMIIRAKKNIKVDEEIVWNYKFDEGIVEFLPAKQKNK